MGWLGGGGNAPAVAIVILSQAQSFQPDQTLPFPANTKDPVVRPTLKGSCFISLPSTHGEHLMKERLTSESSRSDGGQDYFQRSAVTQRKA